MKNTVLLAMLLVLIPLPGIAQGDLAAPGLPDTLQLKDGRMLKGTIITEVLGDHLLFRLGNGVETEVPLDAIDRFAGRGTRASDFTAMDPLSLASEYEHGKKSRSTAATWALLLPSAGHIYAGADGRGVLFLAGESLCAVLAASSVKRTTHTYQRTGTHINWWSGRETPYTYTTTETGYKYNAGFGIGIAAFLVLKICEVADASAQADHYNERLMESMQRALTDNNISLDFTGTLGDGCAVGLRVGI